MADHFAEQIMQAVLSKLTGLTTGAKSYRDKNYQYDKLELPARSIFMGVDEPVDKDAGAQTIQLQDHYLEFEVEHIAESASQAAVTTTLNLMRKETHVALMADATLGLLFAFGLEYLRTEKPDIQHGEKILGSMVSIWAINYRSSYLDPSV